MQVPTELHHRLIIALRHNARTFQHILAATPPADASTYRDGGDGWTALEIVGHIHDFDKIFLLRARRILTENNPALAPADHEQLVRDAAYNTHHPDDLAGALAASRRELARFFRELDAADWDRAGVHPERETPFTLADALLQVATHDANHLEQLTRVLARREQ